MGRRVVRSYSGADSGTGWDTERIAYDGLKPLEESLGGLTVRRYYYGEAMNHVVLAEADADADGNPGESGDYAYAPLTDDRRTVVGITDAKGNTAGSPSPGTILEKLHYNATGLIKSYDASDDLNDDPGENPYRGQHLPLGWCGMHKDRFTGHYHTHFREYDPVHERWLSEDPAGYQDGLNLYAAYLGVNDTDVLNSSTK